MTHTPIGPPPAPLVRATVRAPRLSVPARRIEDQLGAAGIFLLPLAAFFLTGLARTDGRSVNAGMSQTRVTNVLNFDPKPPPDQDPEPAEPPAVVNGGRGGAMARAAATVRAQ